MGKRVVFGILMIAVLCGLVWLDHSLGNRNDQLAGLVLGALALIVAPVGYVEYTRLARGAGGKPFVGTGAFLAAVVALWPLNSTFIDSSSEVLVGLAFLVAIVFGRQMVTRTTDGAITRVATTLLGVFYLGGCIACILLVRLDFGVPALLLFLAGAKLTDVGAYFVGSRFGKSKIIPWLSPAKSWQGLWGGLAAGIGACVGLNAFWSALGIPIMLWWQAGLFGLVMGLVGQFGDLCESLLKRDAKIKDSASLVPEFGGVLDILDSALIAAPLAYMMLHEFAEAAKPMLHVAP